MSLSSRPDWARRLDALRHAMDRRGLEALLVSSLPNVRYLCGFVGSAGQLMVSARAAWLVVDGRYTGAVESASSRGGIGPVSLEPVVGRYDQTVARLIERFGIRECGFEAADVTVSTLRRWQAGATCAWIETSDLVEALRLTKDASEIATLREAARRLSDVARTLPELVREDRTEREVSRLIDLGLDRAGFEAPAFPTIVASGPNSAHPHAIPGDRRLGSGDLVVLDFGGVLDGYCVDLTRMAGVGSVPTAAEGLYAAVREAQDAAIASVRAGIPGVEVDRAARDALERRGLGEAFLHSTGHGLGLEVHEGPRLGQVDAEAPLGVGMVCTIEPGAYVREIGGVRLEDDVLVTAEGCEVLTDAPRDLIIV